MSLINHLTFCIVTHNSTCGYYAFVVYTITAHYTVDKNTCADGRTQMRTQQLNIAVGRQPSPGLGFMGSNGGDLSPTSNQLARWFSPELLAQARAGKLPELGQTNVLSLEELERLQHASTIVHN